MSTLQRKAQLLGTVTSILVLGVVIGDVTPAEAQRCYNCVRGPISWGSIRMASQPRYVAQPRIYGPMAGSTPMRVSPGYRGIPYGWVASHGARYAAGSYMMASGYPIAGRFVRGAVGMYLWPSCVGEGCTGWKRYVFP
jgi:hypothetical protein